MATASEIADFADQLVRTREIPDYPAALNGLQVGTDSAIRGLAAAVDFSSRSVGGAVAMGANFLVVHHGAFWNTSEQMIGSRYRLFKMLFDEGVAIYSSHIPLDCHPTLGNNVLLAQRFGLAPDGTFGRYKDVLIGVTGESTIPIAELVERADKFAGEHGGRIRHTPFDKRRKTGRWAICSGAGADSSSLEEARQRGVGVLIVGEGPHWTAVSAEENDLVIIYAGHYATETPGVDALAKTLAAHFKLPSHFIPAPTGT